MPRSHGARPSPSRLMEALTNARTGPRAFADAGGTARRGSQTPLCQAAPRRGPRGCPPRHPSPHHCSLCGRIQPNQEAHRAENSPVGINVPPPRPQAGSPRCPGLSGIGAGLSAAGGGRRSSTQIPPMPPRSQHFFPCILLIPRTSAADGPRDAGRDKALLTLPGAAFPPLDSINYGLF